MADWLHDLAAFHGARTAVVRLVTTERPGEPFDSGSNLAFYWTPAAVRQFWQEALAAVSLSEDAAGELVGLGVAGRLARLKQEAPGAHGSRRRMIDRLQVSETSSDTAPADLFEWLEACFTMPDEMTAALAEGRRREAEHVRRE